jgi:putative ABC transport system permease protein
MKSISAKLAFSHLLAHRTRAMLTILAIALSVSLVVCVTSSYRSIHSAAHHMMAQYMGTTDAQIRRREEMQGGIDAALMEQLRADADVVAIVPRLEMDGAIQKTDGDTVARGQLVGLRRPDDQEVDRLRLEQGRWFAGSGGNDIVVDQVAFERLGIKLNEKCILRVLEQQIEARVVGVVHKPAILAGLAQTVYLPIDTLATMQTPQQAGRFTRAMIDLKPAANETEFETRWNHKLTAIDPTLTVTLGSARRGKLDANLEGLSHVSYMAGMVSMLAATFIIFSALSMGVTERQRTLAMLRAIGALRSQLAKTVIIESLLLAIAGVLVGIPLGLGFLFILTTTYSEIFVRGVTLSYPGIAFAALGSIATALIASLLPAFHATRTSPLEAMSPLAKPPANRGVAISTLAGLILVSIDPILLFGPFSREVKFYGHFTAGISTLMLGFFLLAPIFVITIEFTLGRVVAMMLGIRFVLLRQQLSSGIWRAAGTCAALMVGLAILIVTQTQGTTAIQSWKIPDKFPDIFIYSAFGMDADGQAKLKTAPGINPDQFLPIAIASPQFGSSIFGLAGAALVPDATMFFGIDPDLGLEMMMLEFREGNPEQAREMLKKGKHLIISEEYRAVKKLGVGDTLKLKTNRGEIDFTVAGVIWSPGIDVFASLYDLRRQLDQRTAASVFGSLEDANYYFGIDNIHLFAANLNTSMEKWQLMEVLSEKLNGWGLQVGDVRGVKFTIQTLFSRMLLLVGSVAYAAMAVASLGVANTIVASVRTRRWHFGILRSIGVTRGQLLRLILAEAILLGCAGAILGAVAGFELAIDARQGWGEFVGIKPPMVIPFARILVGAGVLMLVSILASLAPAIGAARSEPLSLLQAGRAAT